MASDLQPLWERAPQETYEMAGRAKALVDKLNIQNLRQILTMFEERKSLSLPLEDGYTLQYIIKNREFSVVHCEKTSFWTSICPVKGCPNAIFMGYRCAEHSVNPSSPRYSPASVTCESSSTMCNVLVSNNSSQQINPDSNLSRTGKAFVGSIITTEGIERIFAAMYMDRKIGSTLTASERQAVLLNSIHRQSFIDKNLGVTVSRNPANSQSLKIQIISNHTKFYTCRIAGCNIAGEHCKLNGYDCGNHKKNIDIPRKDITKCLKQCFVLMNRLVDPAFTEAAKTREEWIRCLMLIYNAGDDGLDFVIDDQRLTVTFYLNENCQFSYVHSQTPGRHRFICFQFGCITSKAVLRSTSQEKFTNPDDDKFKKFLCKKCSDKTTAQLIKPSEIKRSLKYGAQLPPDTMRKKFNTNRK